MNINNIDDLREMTPLQLVDAALAADRHFMFWLILGFLCAALDRQQRIEYDQLWETAYKQPESGYTEAVRLLNELKIKLS